MDDPVAGHEHEPAKGSCRPVTLGKRFSMLDKGSYPVIGKCKHCNRYIRCNVIGGPWLASDEHAGAPQEDWSTPTGDSQGGNSLFLRRERSNSGIEWFL